MLAYTNIAVIFQNRKFLTAYKLVTNSYSEIKIGEEYVLLPGIYWIDETPYSIDDPVWHDALFVRVMQISSFFFLKTEPVCYHRQKQKLLAVQSDVEQFQTPMLVIEKSEYDAVRRNEEIGPQR